MPTRYQLLAELGRYMPHSTFSTVDWRPYTNAMLRDVLSFYKPL